MSAWGTGQAAQVLRSPAPHAGLVWVIIPAAGVPKPRCTGRLSGGSPHFAPLASRRQGASTQGRGRGQDPLPHQQLRLRTRRLARAGEGWDSGRGERPAGSPGTCPPPPGALPLGPALCGFCLGGLPLPWAAGPPQLTWQRPSHSGGHFVSTAERIRLPDDCTVGYIVEALLGVRLIRSGLFHSHLENLQQVPAAELHEQVRRLRRRPPDPGSPAGRAPRQTLCPLSPAPCLPRLVLHAGVSSRSQHRSPCSWGCAGRGVAHRLPSWPEAGSRQGCLPVQSHVASLGPRRGVPSPPSTTSPSPHR